VTIRAVHHINCATFCPLAGFVHGARKVVVHCLVVETERDGLVLVDTGLGTRDVAGHTRISPLLLLLGRATFDTALAQVEALGHRASDVRHIVVTHLDFDHAGGLYDFPHAQVHVHAREHAAAMARATVLERERYKTVHWAHGPQWQVYREDGDTWRGLPAVTRLRGLDADIGLVPMHGHTRGHSAIVVRHGDTWLVHAGDAYFHHAALDTRHSRRPPLGLVAFERMMQTDAGARRASLAALRQLRERNPDVRMFCAHDPAEYAEYAAASSRPA
jgi:glyoxylase-like metal-dependent hydrolase (beta-lactamase superfamily II)